MKTILRIASRIAAVAMFLPFVLPPALRAQMGLAEAWRCVMGAVVCALPVCCAALVALWLAECLPSRMGRIAARTAAGALLGFEFLDTLVLRIFSTRLHLSDLAYGAPQHSADFIANIPRLFTASHGLLLFAVILALCCVGFVRLLCPGHHLIGAMNRRFILWLALIGVSASVINPVVLRPLGNSAVKVRSAVEVNLTDSSRTGFPQSDATRIMASPPLPLLETIPGGGKHPNIVLLVVESWSPYQSAFFSGIGNMTPELDRLAASGRYYTDFRANGYCTEHGLISMLGGGWPITRLGAGWEPTFGLFFAGHDDPAPSLPSLLRPHGYRTAFLTTGNLGFSDKGVWLQKIGFDYMEGHNAPSYADLPRFHIDAADDTALYRRALQWIERDAPERFCLVLETVTSHLPWWHPRGGSDTEEAVMAYTDEAAAAFCRELVRRGFTDRNLLIVTSDHRALTAARHDEIERLGPAYRSRIPMFMLGPGAPQGRVDTPLQQNDLPASLAWLVSQSPVAWDTRRGNIFDPVRPPREIVHQQSLRRDKVDVFLPAKGLAFEVRLDGPRTRAVPARHGPDAADAVARINYERVRAARQIAQAKATSQQPPTTKAAGGEGRFDQELTLARGKR